MAVAIRDHMERFLRNDRMPRSPPPPPQKKDMKHRQRAPERDSERCLCGFVADRIPSDILAYVSFYPPMKLFMFSLVWFFDRYLIRIRKAVIIGLEGAGACPVGIV